MPLASRIRWTTTLLFIFLLALATHSAEALPPCTSTASIPQWQCWEQTIASDAAFSAGNPYRDLTLRIHFVSQSGFAFDQDAYWAGDATHSLFKVRAALPVGTLTPIPSGTWTWSIASCSGTTGGKSCASGVTWTPSTGPITVTASTSGPQIYARGFLRQFGFVTPTTYSLSQLLYDDYSPFFWAADTAWAGPGKEAASSTGDWIRYITDRASKQFRGLLVAPAALTPAASVFVTTTGCTDTAPLPNSCSTPKPAFWDAFDNEILAANQKDLVPLIAGVVDPLNNGLLKNPGSYPKQANAIAFARYLAARMAGFAVLYSPGFDTSPAATTADVPRIALQQVMSAVGQALHQADSRRPLTNHLSGNSTCTDYENLRSSGWMTFFLFQSGHALSPNGVAGTSCPGFLGSETAVNAAIRRARQVPWTLYSSTAQPSLPSYNGEGPYDMPDNDCATNPLCQGFDPHYFDDIVDIRYHDRQAAYLSSLSGAYGFTYGVDPIGKWNNPMSYTSRPSAGDIGSVYTTFRTVSNLSAHPDWIANQAPDPNNDSKKMALASDGSPLVLAYVPAFRVQGADMIQISTNSLPGLGCNGWTFTWEHAQDLVPDTLAVSCTGANPITVTAPNPTIACTSNYKECDWVLQIKKTSPPSSMAQIAPSSPSLDVWADASPSDGTSAIYARRAGTGLAPILVSPSGVAFQQAPSFTRMPGGFLAVWHADGLDGSLLGVFAQRLDSTGHPVGPKLQVNTTTEEDQRDPALDSDPLGNALVAWMSYGQDGDLGGIVGRLLDSTGKPASAEFLVNTTTAGHQERPQVVALPGGAFVVAWQTRAMSSASGALSFRVFSNAGRSLTDEVRIPVSSGAYVRLVDLAATPAGSVLV
ncbi:MAG: DUF4038 domain-containing protein [Thermoanaerobaculia bacterium]